MPLTNYWLKTLLFCRLPFRICYLFVCLLIAGDLCAQEPIHRRISVNDGLVGNKAYLTFEDSKGFIWMATETGVSRFDGKKFVNFTTTEGLQTNEIFAIREDSQGRIWFLGFSQYLTYYRNGKIFTRKDDPVLEEIKSMKFFLEMFEDAQGTLWFTTSTSGIIRLTQEGKVIHPPKPQVGSKSPLNSYCFHLIEDEEQNIIVFSTHGITKYFPKSNQHEDIETFGTAGSSRLPLLIAVAEKGNGEVMVTYENKFLIYDLRLGIITQKHTLPELKTAVVRAAYDDSGNLWIATFNFLGKFKDGKIEMESLEKYFQGIHFSSILQDREGSFWFSTQSKGVMFSPSAEAFLHQPEVLEISGYGGKLGIGPDQKIWMGVGRGWISKFDNGKFENKKLGKTDARGRILDYYLDDGGRFWTIADRNIFIFRENEVSHWTEGAKAITQDANGDYWLGGASSVSKYAKEKIDDVWKSQVFQGKDYSSLPRQQLADTTLRGYSVFDLHTTERGQLLMGSNKGLFVIQNDSISALSGLPEHLKTRISAIKEGKRGQLFIGTYENGLTIQNGDQYNWLQKSDGLAGNIVLSVYVDEEDGCWVGTNQGLSYVHEIGKDEYSITNFTISDGLPSNQIEDVLVRDGIVYISTEEGLTTFARRALLREISPPLLYLNWLQGGDSVYTKYKNLEFAYDQNNIKVNYSGISPRSFGKITYKYRLFGLDTIWHFTPFDELEFLGLAPGEYQLEIYSINKNDISSIQPIEVSFAVKAPLWMQWWFWLLIILTGLGIIAVVVYKIIQNMREREARKSEIQQKLAEFELKALQTQMNPHFIFNSLNSVQRFIFSNDKVSAYHYLERFGTLIRRILENSRKKTITLQEEVETLQLYLELESLRFDEKFQYEFDVDEALPLSSVQVPPMIVQPYIENAIWHGLMPKSEEGHLKIHISQEGNTIKVIVEDDGIGREEAGKIKRKHKQKGTSTGLTTTAERLRILSIQQAVNYTVEIEDLYRQDGTSAGTRVILRLPVHNN